MRAYRLGAVLLASALGVASAAVGRAQGTEEEPATAAAWIWYPERPAVEGAGQTRYLRKVVRLQGKPTEAWLRVLADDSLTFTVNGQPAPLAQERLKGGAVYDLRTVLGPGENVLGFAVHNATGPGGLLVRGVVREADGTEHRIVSDRSFRAARQGPEVETDRASTTPTGRPPPLWGVLFPALVWACRL
jgi:hypothetical protein